MKRYVVPRGVPAHELIAMTVHDLRTPVTAIKGFSQLALRKKTLPPDVRQHLDLVVAETNRISALIDDLVLLGRLEQGEESVCLAVVDLPDLLDSVAATLSRAGLGRRVQRRDGVPPVQACCDPSLTERAIVNLVRYALKFADGDEPIALGARVGSAGPAIVVASSALPGPDGSEDAVRADDGGPRGLGTYISGALIEIQRGELWIDNLAGGGVRFDVLLSEGQDVRPSTKGGAQRWS